VTKTKTNRYEFRVHDGALEENIVLGGTSEAARDRARLMSSLPVPLGEGGSILAFRLALDLDSEWTINNKENGHG
jgi:hypothetical protein